MGCGSFEPGGEVDGRRWRTRGGSGQPRTAPDGAEGQAHGEAADEQGGAAVGDQRQGQFGEPFQLIAGQDRAGRVGRGIDQQCARPAVD